MRDLLAMEHSNRLFRCRKSILGSVLGVTLIAACSANPPETEEVQNAEQAQKSAVEIEQSPTDAIVENVAASEISSKMPYEYKRIQILDSEIAYIDEGEGAPIVFLHGNPTSSYMWRNIMPHLEGQGRLLAPDLIGMGKSGKNPSGSYRFVDHYRYLDAWIEEMDLGDDIVFVTHSWGTALGFHWGYEHPGRVQGYAYAEAHIRPRVTAEFTELEVGLLTALKSEQGEEMILNQNIFVEQVLPGSVIRTLSDEEMAAYREPFLNAGEDRRPTLTWPREIPMDGQPEDVTRIISTFYDWLNSEASPPKLYFQTDPGLINSVIIDDILTLPNQEVVKIKGNHVATEDSPHEFGAATSDFVRKLRE